MFLLLPLLLFTLPAAYTIRTSYLTLAQRVECTNERVEYTRSQDCVDLIHALSYHAEYFDNIRYGPTQPEPGKTPKEVQYRTCTLKIDKRNSAPPFPSDTFSLIDYQDLLRIVIMECLRRRRPGGKILMGNQQNFFGYLGGIPVEQSMLAAGVEGSVLSTGFVTGTGRILAPTA